MAAKTLEFDQNQIDYLISLIRRDFGNHTSAESLRRSIDVLTLLETAAQGSSHEQPDQSPSR